MAAAARGGGRYRPAGREQSLASVVLSSLALALLLFLSTFLPHDTSGVVSGGRPRGEEAASPSRAAKPPHIVVVIVDDAGVNDVGYSASRESPLKGKTPVLDALAAESVRLKEYYAHPVCTPTRAALLTGRYAANTGLVFPLLAHAVAGIDPSMPTMAERLRDHGYRTHLVGKWHVGNSQRSMLPTKRGFDSFFGLVGGGFDHYTKEGAGQVDLWRNTRQLSTAEIDPTDHATNLFSREAIAVIQQHAAASPGKPLFLYLGYTAPHDPLQADPEYLAKCAGVPNRHRRAFCGMMAQLDAGIGNVTQALRDTGMWEDTVFLFTSDNGGNPIVGGFNYMFRGAKSTSWEGGVRVPGFVRAPKRFSFVPRDFRGLVHVADWLPTFLALAGAKPPTVTDGFDLSAAFRSRDPTDKGPRRSVLMQHDVFMNATAYRSGCHKLVLGCPGGRALYLEPDHRLLRVLHEEEEGYPAPLETAANAMMERGFDLIEHLVQPPVDQFLKYTLMIQLTHLQDWWAGTSYTHFVNSRYQNISLWKADLREHPPVLDWDTQFGPKTMLYDLCQDPQESRNLATTEHGKRLAERLYTEVLEVIKDAPIQYAGDTMVRLPSEGYKLIPGQRLAPFVPDGSDPAELDIVSDRLFTLFGRLAMYLLFTVLALLTGTIALLLACCCCRGGGGGAKEEDESSDDGGGVESPPRRAAGRNGGVTATAAGRAAAPPDTSVGGRNGGRANGGGRNGNGRNGGGSSSKRKTQ